MQGDEPVSDEAPEYEEDLTEEEVNEVELSEE